MRTQQVSTRLRSNVIVKPMTGDVFAYDGLDSIEATEFFGRVQKSTFADIIHTRRKIERRRFEVTLPVDDSDVRGMLLDPTGNYARAAVQAIFRKLDKVIIDAADADVKVGRESDGTVTFDSESTTVDATSGLTYEKLLEITQNFIDEEVGNDMPEDFAFTITGKEHTALMNETKLTSGDFSREFVVDKGMITRAAGLELIRYGANVNAPILSVNSGTRDLFAFSKRAICVGMSKELSINVKERTELIETTQVQVIGQFGAVRTEGVLIQTLGSGETTGAVTKIMVGPLGGSKEITAAGYAPASKYEFDFDNGENKGRKLTVGEAFTIDSSAAVAVNVYVEGVTV